jgi:hypothetical protein
MRSVTTIPALILLGLLGLLAGCSGPTSSSTSSSAGSGAMAAPGSVREAAPSAASQGGGAATKARVANASAINYTAELTVRATRVSDATDAAAQIAASAGGYVANETTSSGSAASADIQLRIPVSAYPATLSRLAELGTRLSLNQQAQDLTEQVADVNSQVTSDQAAIMQLRALLSHAGSVGDLLTVQNQINSEESNLESIEAQQRALSNETSYATVTMTILGPTAKPVVKPHKATPPPNLARGLSAGWRALRITVDWTLALLGALAPFLAVVGVALFAGYRGRRWLLRRRAA